MDCTRIRFGGTISGSTLSGGTVVESQALGLTSWDGMLGHPGRRGSDLPLLGNDGNYRRERKPYRARLMTLSVAAWDRSASGTITAPNGRCEQLDDNEDTLLALVDGDGETFIIERDMTDGTTRWIEAEISGAATFTQGPLFGTGRSARTLLIPLTCWYPFWQSETLNTDTITGVDTISNAGNARIQNMVLAYSGDGTFTNSDEAVNLEVSGSGSTVTVDVGAKTVVESGSPADNLLIVDRDFWMVFGPGTTGS